MFFFFFLMTTADFFFLFALVDYLIVMEAHLHHIEINYAVVIMT